jgi:hypothetical protein
MHLYIDKDGCHCSIDGLSDEEDTNFMKLLHGQVCDDSFLFLKEENLLDKAPRKYHQFLADCRNNRYDTIDVEGTSRSKTRILFPDKKIRRKPQKKVKFRCPKRLIDSLRAFADSHELHLSQVTKLAPYRFLSDFMRLDENRNNLIGGGLQFARARQ